MRAIIRVFSVTERQQYLGVTTMDIELKPNTWADFTALKKANARAQNNFYADADVEVWLRILW